jgi:hypothetical protein
MSRSLSQNLFVSTWVPRSLGMSDTAIGAQVASANNVLARNSKTGPAKSHTERPDENLPCLFFCGIFLWSLCSDRGTLPFLRAIHEVRNVLRESQPSAVTCAARQFAGWRAAVRTFICWPTWGQES